MRQTVGILGTPIDILDTAEVLARLDQFIQERRFHQVATANTDFLINALTDSELRHILRNADLVMPDGMPVVWAARLMRSALPERVTGADIVPALAQLAAEKGYRVFMLGARPEIAERARLAMEQDYPGLRVVGCFSPPNRPLLEMDNVAILAKIHAAAPDILLVAFGNPKQEKWIHMHCDELRDVSVCIGVGGTFDFLAGENRRAPGWMRSAGLEWAFRLAQEPRRLWKRYVRDIFEFSRYLVKQWWALRRTRFSGVSRIARADVGEFTVLSVTGNLDGRLIVRFQSLANEALNAHRHLVFDFSAVTGLDGAALGTLINLTKRASFCGCDVRLVAVPKEIERMMARSHLGDGIIRLCATMADAFSTTSLPGLRWETCIGTDTAAVTAHGASEPMAARNLERVCRRILESKSRLDLDLADVHYVDSTLLASLCALREIGCESDRNRLRIVASSELESALVREQLQDTFVLIPAAEIPTDGSSELPVMVGRQDPAEAEAPRAVAM